MDLRHYLLVCPGCGAIWGRTDELTQEDLAHEAAETIEHAQCPACRSRSARPAGEAPQKNGG